jgi:excisionase family DNA binding protein
MVHAHVPDVPLEERRAYSLAEVAGLTGFAVSTLYKFLTAGRLKSRKIGGRRVILSEDLDTFLRGGGET